MDAQIIQNLRYKLQKRIRRLNSANTEVFAPVLQQFWAFFDNQQTLDGIIRSVVSAYPRASEIVDNIFEGTVSWGATEEEAAVIGYEILRRIKDEESMRNTLHAVSNAQITYDSNYEEILNTFRDVFLEPFYEYIDEQLDDQRAILSLLYRYKHRIEWFNRERLSQLYQNNTTKGEKLLALDLYSYLHDQGFNFSIEPSSIDGSIDLISIQDSDDPLLADAKIFDGDSRGKTYLCKGFNQIYTYTQQYNEPFGYLVIFKVTDRDLRFSLATDSRNVPVVTYNHKTIFLITIDIYPHPKPVSQRNPINAIEIKEEDLVRSVEGGNPESITEPIK